MIFDYFSIVIGILKFCILKLIYIFRIKLDGIPKINGNFKIVIPKGTKLFIGKRFKARNNINIRNDYNGKIYIGNNVFFNDNVSLNCQKKIVIGNNVSLGHNVIIIDHDHDYKNNMKEFKREEIVIGNNVWIGANSIILRGCKIPDNTVIAAGTILSMKNNELIEKNNLIYNKREVLIREFSK